MIVVFILGSVLGFDEWHLPICYQNPTFSWENACTKSGMCCFSVVPLIENSDVWRMRLGEWYRCYYFYSVVCQQIWRNVLPLFFPRYTGVKKTQHYKHFISNPIVLFWRTKKKNNNNTRRTVSPLLSEKLLEKLMLAKTKHKNLWKFYWNPFCCLGRVMDNATSILSLLYSLVWQLHSLKWQKSKNEEILARIVKMGKQK
jgi:hypothetical protein